MTIDIEWLVYFDPKQTRDVFYCDGSYNVPICVVKGEEKKVLIVCDGEMYGFYNKNTEDEYHIRSFWDLEKLGIKTDDDLERLEDKIEWDFNPWFDAYDITNDYQPEIGPDNSGIHLDMVSADIYEILNSVKEYMNEGEYYDQRYSSNNRK